MRPRRHGVVSVVALVAVIACAVGAASIAAWSAAQRDVADARGRREVGVNLALSGVHGVAAEIAKQRQDLLRGGTLNLTGHTAVWTGTDAGGAPMSGVVRLMPIGADGALMQMEGAKLDVNEVGEERLKEFGSLDAAVLDKVISGRATRAWGSVWEIQALGPTSAVDGARAPQSLRAPTRRTPSSSPTSEPSTPAPTTSLPADAPPPGAGATDAGATPSTPEEPADDVHETLSVPDALTCYSADPQARSGFTAAGAMDPDATGRARVVLPETWSAEVEKQLATELGEQWSTWLRGQYGANRRPTSAAALATNAAAGQVEPVVVAGMLDTLEFDDAGTRRGLVDLLTAPAEVLGGVPGIPAALADRIVAARGKLEVSRRATPLWPVLEGLVELGEFAPALDFVTSRCLVFRVMVEGGVVSGELRGEPESWVLRDRWAYEVIIDASEEPVRIAYLRAAAFDGLVIPGAKEAEGASTPTEAEAENERTGPGPEADERVSVGDDGKASAAEGADEEPAGAPSPSGSGRSGAGVDSPAGASPAPTPTAAPASSTPARSRIGRWNGGGGSGGGGGSRSGGTPK